jgi:ubiquinone/menaquinone biosynthesis C-methylase UbiE
VRTLNSFDRIAPFYDRLASMVFGSALREAQRAHLGSLIQSREVLILGGGTGGLLKDFLVLNSTARVIYLEASQRMIELTLKNLSDADRHRVVFVHGTDQTLPPESQFDAIVINFFVDMFSSAELTTVLRKLRLVLRPGGQLLCTDFVDDARWKRSMLSAMYTFFRVTAGLQNQQLAPWQNLIIEEGFERRCSTAFWKGFICSELFVKTSGNKECVAESM